MLVEVRVEERASVEVRVPTSAHTNVLSRRERATRGCEGCEMGSRKRGARKRVGGEGATCQGERRVTHSLRVTYTNRRTSRAGRQLATCSLLCSHTRARINLSVSCHVQRSHSLSPAAYRHSRPSCCRRLRAQSLLAHPPPYLINKSTVRSVFLEIPTNHETRNSNATTSRKVLTLRMHEWVACILTEQII